MNPQVDGHWTPAEASLQPCSARDITNSCIPILWTSWEKPWVFLIPEAPVWTGPKSLLSEFPTTNKFPLSGKLIQHRRLLHRQIRIHASSHPPIREMPDKAQEERFGLTKKNSNKLAGWRAVFNVVVVFFAFFWFLFKSCSSIIRCTIHYSDNTPRSPASPALSTHGTILHPKLWALTAASITAPDTDAAIAH